MIGVDDFNRIEEDSPNVIFFLGTTGVKVNSFRVESSASKVAVLKVIYVVRVKKSVIDLQSERIKIIELFEQENIKG